MVANIYARRKSALAGALEYDQVCAAIIRTSVEHLIELT
jgi:hypothetical protein